MTVALVAAVALAVVHLYANRVVRLRSIPRSRALSVASGISVAYVFVHLLPELAATQRELGELAAGIVPLVERARGVGGSLVWFAVAMGVHFVVNDHGLAESHGELYHDRGRWLVAAGILMGWALAAALPVSVGAIGMLTALLGGGVVLNVLKEELPAARESSVGAFASGAAAYTAVLLLA